MQGWEQLKYHSSWKRPPWLSMGVGVDRYIALRMLHFSCGRKRVKPGLSYLCGPSAAVCTCNAGARYSLPAPGFNELQFVNGHPDLVRMWALTSNIFFKKQRPTHYCKKSYYVIISNRVCEIHLVCKTVMSNNFFHRFCFLINNLRSNEWNMFMVLEPGLRTTAPGKQRNCI